MEHLKAKLLLRIQRIQRQLNEARLIIEDENDTVKLLGMHDRLFASNADLVRIYGEFAELIAADDTELKAVVQHDLAIDMLANLHFKMLLLEPPLQWIMKVPVAKSIIQSRNNANEQ